MPKYTFRCTCGNKKQKYTTNNTSILCECGSVMEKLLPIVSNTEVKEVYDPYTNVSLNPEFKSQIDERRLDHYWSVIVPRLVSEYSLEHSLKEGWVYYDEKGQLQVHTKPPHKR